MKSYNYVGIGLAIILTGTMALQAQSVPSSAAQATPAHAAEPVLKINGKTVTADQLTSFATLLGQTETGYPPEGNELLNEFILTQLYDKIPTTATLPAEQPSVSSTSVADVNQRGYLKRLLREKLTKEVQVPREAMETWYKENLKQYQKPEQVHAWHIFMETSDDNASSAPQVVREKMQKVKSEIDAGTSFSQAAKEYSEAASGEKGGEIGQISPRLAIGPLSKPMNPELETVFFKLPVNKVSDVVETRHGIHLLYITDKHTTRTPSIDDLITSGILPGNLAQDLVTSNIRELTEKAIERHHGQVLPGFDDASPITTGTVVFEFDGKKTTVGDLTSIFGERFTVYLDRIKTDKEAFRKLMTEGMNDEAMVLAAVDLGVTTDAEHSRTMEELGRRGKAAKRIAAITDAEASVTPADIEAKYVELTDQLRQPEAEGYVLEVQVTTTSDTAEQAKAQNVALKTAEQLAVSMKDDDFAAFAKKVSAQNDAGAHATKITRHVMNSSTDTVMREFDRAIGTVQGQVGVSSPTPLGDKIVVAKAEARYPGQPVALDTVRDRLKSMLEGEKRAAVRQILVKRLITEGLAEYLPGAQNYGAPMNADTQTSSTDASTTPSQH